MFDWEFRNGWKWFKRRWSGFTLIGFNIYFDWDVCTIWIAILGFEIFLHFGKLED